MLVTHLEAHYVGGDEWRVELIEERVGGIEWSKRDDWGEERGGRKIKRNKLNEDEECEEEEWVGFGDGQKRKKTKQNEESNLMH